MHYIAYVSVHGLYAWEAANRLSWPPEKPLVVIRDSCVIDLNASASSAGCSVGMTKFEATAVLADSSCLIPYSRDHIAAIRERWLAECSQFSDIIEPNDCHSAFIDLSLHTDPLDVARALMASIRKAVGLESEIRISSAKWLSRIAPSSLDSIQEVKDWLPKLGVENLPIERKDVLRLKLLGYRTVGEVAALPKSLIKKQFCERAWLIHDLANGKFIDLPKPLFPESSSCYMVEIEGGSSDWQSIERAIHRLSVPLAKTLSRLDSFTRRIELEVAFESGKIASSCRSFAKPIYSRTGIVRGIAVMLPEISEPITALKATLQKLERRVRAQRTLDDAIGDRKLSADSALQALRSSFGDSSIKVADEIEQPRHVEVMRAWKAATGWF